MIKLGDTKFFLFDRVFGHQIRLPAPGKYQQCVEHLSQLTPRQREGLEIVEMQAICVISAEDALRVKSDTDRAPPLTEAEFDAVLNDRDARAEMTTLDDEAQRMVGSARGAAE